MSKRSFTPLRYTLLFLMIFTTCMLCSCGKKGESSDIEVKQSSQSRMADDYGNLPAPSATGAVTQGNDAVTIDTSNSGEGYIYTTYKGNNHKVKLQLTGPDSVTYTYNIKAGDTCLPLSAGDGSYQIAIYENISGDQYATAYSGSFNAKLSNPYGPYLYPNQYVNFTASSNAVSLAKQMSQEATCDLETVAAVYHYVTDHIKYDDAEAATVAYDYLPDVDEVLSTEKGICFDYAALMAAMLRSQGIPTRLHVGYAADAYHAWINVYIKDIGWIDGIIEFDGTNWSLMDPTFAANKNSKSAQEFIGDGKNYTTLFTY